MVEWLSGVALFTAIKVVAGITLTYVGFKMAFASTPTEESEHREWN